MAAAVRLSERARTWSSAAGTEASGWEQGGREQGRVGDSLLPVLLMMHRETARSAGVCEVVTTDSGARIRRTAPATPTATPLCLAASVHARRLNSSTAGSWRGTLPGVRKAGSLGRRADRKLQY